MERSVLVPDVPKEVLFYLAELLGDQLIEDAESRYGNMPNFEGEVDVYKPRNEDWKVSYRIRFSVFDYSFSWRFTDTKKGTLVHFSGSTPGRWWEWMFDMESKLEDLFEDQWSAFCNFSIGYLTALAYEKKGRKKSAREHLRAASKKVRARSRLARKK